MLSRTFSTSKAYLSWQIRLRRNSTLAPLPPLEEWKTLFPFHAQLGRVFVKEKSTADSIAQACLKDKPQDYPTEGKVVIEAFPGTSPTQSCYAYVHRLVFLRTWSLDSQFSVFAKVESKETHSPGGFPRIYRVP